MTIFTSDPVISGQTPNYGGLGTLLQNAVMSAQNMAKVRAAHQMNQYRPGLLQNQTLAGQLANQKAQDLLSFVTPEAKANLSLLQNRIPLEQAQTQSMLSRLPLTKAQAAETNAEAQLKIHYLKNPSQIPGLSQMQTMLATLPKNGMPTQSSQPMQQNGSFMPPMAPPQTNGTEAGIPSPTVNTQSNGTVPTIPTVPINQTDSPQVKMAKNFYNSGIEKQNLALQNQYYQTEAAKQKIQQDDSNKQAARSALNATALLNDTQSSLNNYLQNRENAPLAEKAGLTLGLGSLLRNTQLAQSLNNTNALMANTARQVIRAELGTRSGSVLKELGNEFEIKPFDSPQTAYNKFNNLNKILTAVRNTRGITTSQVQDMIKNVSGNSQGTSNGIIGSMKNFNGQNIRVTGVNKDGSYEYEVIK